MREKSIEELLNERCDGSRNIIHTCIAMSAPTSNKDSDSDLTLTSASGSQGLTSALETINAMSNAVDVLASIQSRLDPTERIHSRTVSLREMMRRATSVARAVSGLDARDSEREEAGGIAIPTLNWPPDPPSYESLRTGEQTVNICIHPDT